MIHYKACHNIGLDILIYQYISSQITPKIDYYFFIYDYVLGGGDKPQTFYDKNCNESNTWNFSLNYHSTEKDQIIKDSILFGFGNYELDNNILNDDLIIVKAKGHLHTTLIGGQAHLQTKQNYFKEYDKTKFVGQKILKNKSQEELNIFIIRDLETRKIHYLYVLCHNDTSVNINRKYSKCTYKIIDDSIMNEREKINFENYINHIKLDYGRVELIKDDLLGWCIIDVNNSPGKGPISNMVYQDLGKIFISILK